MYNPTIKLMRAWNKQKGPEVSLISVTEDIALFACSVAGVGLN